MYTLCNNLCLVIMHIRGDLTDFNDFHICCQGHLPESPPTNFSRRSLFVKKLEQVEVSKF